MRRRTLVASSALAIGAISIGAAGEVLSQPAQRSIGPAPRDLPAETMRIPTDSNRVVAGWLLRGQPGGGVVLLLHGVRADRREMTSRARFLWQLGYSVLWVDLPAHGESPAAHITYGANEALGVKAALEYLSHEFPAEKIGVIGVSLGAASLVLSRPNPAPSAVVLESMYPTIREAVQDRLSLHLGSFAELMAPLLLWQLDWRLGISQEQLRPIADLPALRAPVLIAAGDADRHTTLPETKRLYAAANEPKELWIVQGAAHVDLHSFAPRAYESRVSEFLAKHMGTAI